VENVLTVDLEEWFHANYSDDLIKNNPNYEVRVVENTRRLLQLFKKYKAKATFFTLGYIAEKHPDLLREIAKDGHEIATHGYGHELVYKHSKDEFEADLVKSIILIEKAVGFRPKGYRAPSWSVTKDTLWIYPILEKHGIEYDASVFPVNTFLYGIPDAPRYPFINIYDNQRIPEFPTSTYKFFGMNIPFSGGFYFRAIPYFIIKRFFSSLNRLGKPVVFYIHPREIDNEQPIINNLNARDRFIHYHAINRCEYKISKLLKDFNFITAAEYFESHFDNHLSKL
jgi:polysaccharide deacetylase family protein (PEP-CTERM system associated)